MPGAIKNERTRQGELSCESELVVRVKKMCPGGSLKARREVGRLTSPSHRTIARELETAEGQKAAKGLIC